MRAKRLVLGYSDVPKPSNGSSAGSEAVVVTTGVSAVGAADAADGEAAAEQQRVGGVVRGVPVLYAYIFAAWGFVILLAALVVDGRD